MSHISCNADILLIETERSKFPHPQINLDYEDFTSLKNRTDFS